ncbi:MAG: molybdopterin-dependent oxidoreductase [Veillonella parvula]|nr:molybdopterin-dependent oxidoreductase [Veillonella parvula]
MKEYKSVCPYDCPDACGLIVSVDNNKVISVRGDRAHAFTRGTLCPKMAHYEKVIHSPLRLKYPMKRVGKKGIGEAQYTRISWDEALDAIVNNFKETIDTYGSESILRYSYAGTMGVIQSPAADYFFAKQAGFRSVYGETLGIKPQEAQHSDCIVLWGINATATDVHILHDVNIAKKNGARVWIIDTHKTYTFSQAHEHIYVKPGSDGALALGMLHIIHRDGLADTDFIKEHVQGYDELVKEVLLNFTPEKASDICGVSVDRMTEFAHAYATSKAPFIRLGSGLSRYGNGAMTCRAINALPAVVGAWQYPGGGLLSSASGSKFIGKDMMQQAHVHAPAKRLMPMIKLGEMLTNPERVGVHSLYVFSSNPAITAPNQNVVRKGLMRNDLFTIVHERFFTDTCKYADIILPATTSVEHDDIYNSYGHYTIGTGYKLIDPVGESRSNWQVIAELAKRMGLEDAFFNLSERELIEQIVHTSSRISKRDQELILNGEPVEMTVPENYKMDFKTPSGKIELYNPQDVEPLIRYMPPYGDNAPFWLIIGNDIRILDSSFCELDFNDPELMKLRIHPEDAKMYNINDGAEVEIYNVKIKAYYDDEVQRGTLVTLGVWWQSQSSDPHVAINALTAARPTDQGWGSTFHDVQVHIRNLS